MLEKPSNNVGVRTVQEEIAILAGPRDWGDNRKSWLSRVPQRVERLTAAKLSYRMIKSAWYGQLSEKHWATYELRRAVEVIEAQREYQKLREAQATLEQRLMVLDAEFHQPSIVAHRSLAHGVGGQDQPGAKPEVKLGFDPPQ